MNIKLKTEPRWVTIEDAEFLVDYPTLDQQDEIDYHRDIIKEYYRSSDMVFIEKKEDETDDDFNARFLEQLNSLPVEMKAKVINHTRIAARLSIKYSIKDWKKILDNKDIPVKCKIVNNAIDNDLFDSFMLSFKDNDMSLLTFYYKINEKTEFTETDKKKL